MRTKVFVFLLPLIISACGQNSEPTAEEVSTANDQGWTSGGGDLLEDRQNPWFIQNTLSIKYCLEVDSENFGQTLDVIQSQVERTLTYWKAEFANAPSEPYGTKTPLKIATQNLIQVGCERSDVDLRFQFGVLSPVQKSKLGNVHQTVGVAVRTEYDRVNLRGKGFIYISPAKGPLKFQGKNLIENPWSINKGSLIYVVLLHELGHVFGLQHRNSVLSLMDERFAEFYLNEKLALIFGQVLEEYSMPHFFKFDGSDWPSARCTNTGYSKLITDFYGLPQDIKCLSEKIQDNKLLISAGPDEQNMSVFGGGVFEGQGLETRTSEVSLRFTELQNVFDLKLTDFPMGLMLAESISSERTGIYTNTNGTNAHKIFVRMEPQGLTRVGGILHGDLILDIHKQH